MARPRMGHHVPCLARLRRTRTAWPGVRRQRTNDRAPQESCGSSWVITASLQDFLSPSGLWVEPLVTWISAEELETTDGFRSAFSK